MLPLTFLKYLLPSPEMLVPFCETERRNIPTENGLQHLSLSERKQMNESKQTSSCVLYDADIIFFNTLYKFPLPNTYHSSPESGGSIFLRNAGMQAKYYMMQKHGMSPSVKPRSHYKTRTNHFCYYMTAYKKRTKLALF
jgi:hypothetical protein